MFAALARHRYVIAPILALAFFGLVSFYGASSGSAMTPLGLALAVLLVPVLLGTVFAAVHHAEKIARRVGEPYGTLILTMAVTVIEVALIASLMLAKDSNPALARDTVFSVIMIVCNGLVGSCIMLGGLRYREQGFQVTGASAYLIVLIALGTISLILPNYTTSIPGPVYNASQLLFVSLMTILLYGVFLYIQTARHQDYFTLAQPIEVERHLAGNRTSMSSATAWLFLSVAGVIFLSKKFAAVVEASLSTFNGPNELAGVIVALLILAPESVAAIRAARRDQLQRSLNLALGSSLATIGLTVPAVAVANVALQKTLILGLANKDIVLMCLTFIISILTFGTGRTNILLGLVHLVIFATFVFLLFIP
jgi:Ca2+:H+ antiporter